MTVLLDTSDIIDVLRNRKQRRQWLRGLLLEGHLLACCPVNVAEVYAGMRREEADATDEFFGGLEYIEISETAARKAGLMKSEWKDKGHTLSLPDVLVAAVAMTHGLSLATDNVRHYPMPEIRLLPLSTA